MRFRLTVIVMASVTLAVGCATNGQVRTVIDVDVTFTALYADETPGFSASQLDGSRVMKSLPRAEAEPSGLQPFEYALEDVLRAYGGYGVVGTICMARPLPVEVRFEKENTTFQFDGVEFCTAWRER